MYSRRTAAELAARVRSLIGPVDRAALRTTADELGVHDGDLREIVEFETRYPAVPVLAALVATYGVDAGWLLTGDYSPATHRADEELDEPAALRVARRFRDLDPPAAR